MEPGEKEPVDVSVVQFESHDGTRLEGDLLTPKNPTGSAVVCHPHPLYGGSRQDAAVGALSRAFVGAGLRVLRFDFRGAGGSAGAHDDGGAERGDLAAAIDFVDPTDGPLTLAGYSFGADIALSVAHDAATGWLVVAPPLATVPATDLVASADPRPVTVIAAGHDQFNPPDQLRPRTADWVNTTIHVIETADHFFAGAHHQIGELATKTLAG
ncbi:MAG: CocE/NonD family hydrolase [Acidimicrobiales bacterium]